jgi:hypothetical protein
MAALLATNVAIAFPINTNSGSFNATTNATGDFNAFNWSWMGYENQAINVNLLPAGSSGVWLRLAYPRRGTVFLDVTDGTLANGTNYTATILRSNLPPNGIYFAEFLGFENSYTNIPTRTLATGKINLQRSLFENLTQATWTNPVAGTTIGPPIHTLSALSGWPFVQTNQMGTGATWDGTNWTFATPSLAWSNNYYLASNPSNYVGASVTNGLASTGYVAGVVGGYVATGAVGSAAASNAEAFATAAQGSLADTAWQNPASATNWTWTSDGSAITLTGYSGPNAVVIPDMLDGLPVTAIAVDTFYDNGSITGVTGGANVATIGVAAFELCTNLASASLPSATFVDDNVFVDCFTLASVSLPSAAFVGDGAFGACPELTNVTFSGNAPAEAINVFIGAPNAVIYVDNPTATGWGATWNGRPVVRLPLYGSGANLTGITAAQVAGAVTNNSTGVTLNTMAVNNGFESQYAQTVSFDPVTRQAIITPTGTSFRVTAGGVTYTLGATTSTVADATSGGKFCYIAPGGTFIATNAAWTITGGEAQVIYAYLDMSSTSTAYTLDERHGVNISDGDHLMRHQTVGSTWASGITISHYGVDSTAASASDGSNTCIAITDAGVFWDEDVKHATLPNGSSGGSTNTAGVFPVLWKDGTSWHKNAGTVFPFLWSNATPNYVTAAGAITAVPEDNAFVYWLLALGSADGTNLFLVPHPAVYASVPLAQAGATLPNLSSLLGGFPNSELMACYRLIFWHNATAPSQNPASVKASKLRIVDDYRSVPGGVILAGTGSGVNGVSTEQVIAAGALTNVSFNGTTGTVSGGIANVPLGGVSTDVQYPVFQIDMDDYYTDFEIKASTNNFATTNLLYYFESLGLGAFGGTYTNLSCADTNATVYFCDAKDSDVRVWDTWVNTNSLTAQIGPSNYVATVIFTPSMATLGGSNTWMYPGNNKLIWSYHRRDAYGSETNLAGKGVWHAIRPIEWRTAPISP